MRRCDCKYSIPLSDSRSSSITERLRINAEILCTAGGSDASGPILEVVTFEPFGKIHLVFGAYQYIASVQHSLKFLFS